MNTALCRYMGVLHEHGGIVCCDTVSRCFKKCDHVEMKSRREKWSEVTSHMWRQAKWRWTRESSVSDYWQPTVANGYCGMTIHNSRGDWRARKKKTREFQTQLLHYFFKTDDEGNHHQWRLTVGECYVTRLREGGAQWLYKKTVCTKFHLEY